MPIAIRCKCGKDLKVRDDLAGKAVRCPGCGAVVKVVAASVKTAGPGKPATAAVPRAGVKPGARPGAVPARPQRPGAAPAKAGADMGLIGLPEDMMPKVDMVPTEKCPKCKTLCYKGDLFCTSCGLDFKTGRPVAQRKVIRSYWWVKVVVVLLVLGGGVFFVYKKFFASKEQDKKTTTDQPPVVEDKFDPLRKMLRAETPDFAIIVDELRKHLFDALPILDEVLREAKDDKLFIEKNIADAVAALVSVSLYDDVVADLAGKLLEKKDFPEVFLLMAEALLTMATGTRTEAMLAFACKAAGPSQVERFFQEHAGKKTTVPNEKAKTSLLDNRNFTMDLPMAVRIVETLFFDLSEASAALVLVQMAQEGDEKTKQAGLTGLESLLGFQKPGPQGWRDWWRFSETKKRYEWWLNELQLPNTEDDVKEKIFARMKKALKDKAPTGEEFDYVITASPEEKQAVIQRWLQWWEENKKNDKTK